MKRAGEAIPELAPLKKLKVPELRTLCEAHNLDKAGNKDVLVQRLDALRRGASEGGAAGKASPVAAASTTAARSGAVTPVVTAKQRADEFFQKYADECQTKIGLEGFMRLTVDLAGGDDEKAQMPETTIMILILSWKMGSVRFGEISKEGFKKGLDAMGWHSLEQIVQNRASLIANLNKVTHERSPLTYELLTVDNFNVFYNHTFDLLRPEGKKYVEKDMACLALQAVWTQIPGKKSPHVDSFVEYLNSKEAILSVNQDQWKSFVQFSKQVDGNLTGYTEDDPWPSLFDEYVAWVREKRGGEEAAKT